MSQEKISYEELEKEIIEIIRNRPLKIIATSSGDSVTAREVRFISDGLNMFFLTDNRSRKYEQIKTNPNVAVAVGNLQIEAITKTKDQPLKESEFLELFQETQPDRYIEWSKSGHFTNPNMRVMEVSPKRIALYINRTVDEKTKTYLEILNISCGEAFRLRPSDYLIAQAYRK